MYDDLVNELRHYFEDVPLVLQAADAIEQLSAKYQKALSDLVKQAERKTGRWILDDEYIDCSVCRKEKWSRVPYGNLVKRFRFCPNCGAKMEVEHD